MWSNNLLIAKGVAVGDVEDDTYAPSEPDFLAIARLSVLLGVTSKDTLRVLLIIL